MLAFSCVIFNISCLIVQIIKVLTDSNKPFTDVAKQLFMLKKEAVDIFESFWFELHNWRFFIQTTGH